MKEPERLAENIRVDDVAGVVFSLYSPVVAFLEMGIQGRLHVAPVFAVIVDSVQIPVLVHKGHAIPFLVEFASEMTAAGLDSYVIDAGFAVEDPFRVESVPDCAAATEVFIEAAVLRFAEDFLEG